MGVFLLRHKLEIVNETWEPYLKAGSLPKKATNVKKEMSKTAIAIFRITLILERL
jgi:hypothetical protein